MQVTLLLLLLERLYWDYLKDNNEPMNNVIKERFDVLWFVVAMFIGGFLLAYNPTDTDKEEELSAHIKCLEDK